MRRTFVLTLILFFSMIATPRLARGLNVETHALVNEAASGLTFDLLLQQDLGFLGGLQEPFLGKSASAWIRDGGVQEDATPRFLRHFHDPLQPWDRAGLGSFESSIRWMQRDDQGWSWQAARDSYHAALTEPAHRERAWAATFRGLGQIMHLVVDASVPEHTRNDPHPLGSICRTLGLRCYGNYEYWVSDAQAADVIGFWAAYLSSPISFDTAMFQRPTGDPAAPAAIARLIDTDTYTGDDPSVTIGQAIGIGEVANANFFSEDTGDRTYPFPSVATLEPSRWPAPGTGRTRAYFKKGPADGIPVDPALAECALFRRTSAEGVLRPISFTCVDENVWEATARLMLPRAVGYARVVLDYFFRGRLEVAAPDRFAYGVAAFQPGNTGAFTTLRFKVRNATPGEDTGPGTMTAVVRYRSSAENLIENPFADISEPLYAVSTAIELDGLSPDFREFVFDFRGNQIPANAADVFLTVVYKGRLGLEDDAVLVGSRDLFEPDPVDLANISDWECVQGALYPVWIFSAFPPYSWPGQTERDVDGDGVQDLFGPSLLRNRFLKAFDLTQPPPVPSEDSFDLALSQESFAEYGRLMLLQDQPSYGTAVLTREIDEIPSGLVWTNLFQAGPMRGVRNDVVRNQAGQRVRRVLAAGVYRGIPAYHAVLFSTVGTFPCLPQTQFLPPDLTFIQGTVPE